MVAPHCADPTRRSDSGHGRRRAGRGGRAGPHPHDGPDRRSRRSSTLLSPGQDPLEIIPTACGQRSQAQPGPRALPWLPQRSSGPEHLVCGAHGGGHLLPLVRQLLELAKDLGHAQSTMAALVAGEALEALPQVAPLDPAFEVSGQYLPDAARGAEASGHLGHRAIVLARLAVGALLQLRHGELLGDHPASVFTPVSYTHLTLPTIL